ncbi:MAG: hypothetical protein OJF51_004878 [Nitrospira sp.]|jgi:hypothetical protein|nr:MAG: hypothetical protein OJF51_004878 [Nitrospira sp.]
MDSDSIRQGQADSRRNHRGSRSVQANAPNGGVLHNANTLLRTPPEEFSKFTGMTLITRKTVAEKFAAYLHHELLLDRLVAWAASALMDGEFDPAHLPTIRDVVARIGVADVRVFGLTWKDCEQLLAQLGYSVQVSIAAR